MPTSADWPVLPFASVPGLEEWWSAHHAQVDGLWIRMARKASGIASVTHDEALEVALCYGWIDGLRRRDEAPYFLQSFTPRRPRSHWSARNIAKVTSLMAAGRMQPPGLAAAEAARRAGRWAVTESPVPPFPP